MEEKQVLKFAEVAEYTFNKDIVWITSHPQGDPNKMLVMVEVPDNLFVASIADQLKEGHIILGIMKEPPSFITHPEGRNGYGFTVTLEGLEEGEDITEVKKYIAMSSRNVIRSLSRYELHYNKDTANEIAILVEKYADLLDEELSLGVIT